MSIRRFIFHALCSLLLAVLSIAPECLGQVRPPPLGQDITNASSELTKEQKDKVKAYVDYWAGMLKNPASKPEDVENARAELQRPLGAPGVTPIFRFEYSSLLVPHLDEAVRGTNCHVAVNAFIVASTLGTERAASFLLGHIHADDQKQWQNRLHAASACEMLLRGDWLDVRPVKNATNLLKAAATREDQPAVLRRHLAAIEAADGNRKLTDEVRRDLRITFVETVLAVIDRISKMAAQEREPMLTAVNEALTNFRNEYLSNTVPVPDRKPLGQKLGPALGKLLTIAGAEWDAGHANPNLQKTYSAMIGAWEGFLTSVDAHVRGGTTLQSNLRAAWDANDNARYQTELQQLMTVLQAAPYQ